MAGDDGGAGVVWGTSRTYRSRTHIVPPRWNAGLCGLPVHERWPQRPHGFRVCPECAIAWVTTIFPTSPPRPGTEPSTSEGTLP